MIELLTAILLGLTLGLIAGFMPGIGNTLVLLIVTPFLFQWPPEVSVIFYAVCVQVGNFSTTVSSINFGLLGDMTGEPALRERISIVKNRLTTTSLKFSAISSLVSVAIGSLILFFMLSYTSTSTVALRTETRFLLISVIILFLCFWPSNKIYTNLLLLFIGAILGMIGHHEQLFNYSDVHLLTFNQTAFYSGIPMIVVLCAFLAVPSIIKLLALKEIEYQPADSIKIAHRFPLASSIRGVAIGSFLGMIPMIGTLVSSNVAWSVERIFNKKDSLESSLARLSSAESANNSASITVLIPLLTIGLAIIPSEMILLSVLETKSWIPNSTNWQLSGMAFYQWLVIAIVSTSLISYLICYTFVRRITNLIIRHFKAISYVAILTIAVSIAYSGYNVANMTFYLLIFVALSVIVIINRRIDYMPVVAGYLLIDELLNSARVVFNLYIN